MTDALDLLRQDVLAFCKKMIPGGSARYIDEPAIYWILGAGGDIHTGIVLDGPDAGHVWMAGEATKITAFDAARWLSPDFARYTDQDMIRWFLNGETPDSDIPAVPDMLWRHWKDLDIPEPVYLLGHAWWLEMRAMIYAPTGVGKTQMGMRLAASFSRPSDCCHWPAMVEKGVKTLYVDGEMPGRLARERMADAFRYAGGDDEDDNLYLLNAYLMPGGGPLPSLSNERGRKFIEKCIDQCSIQMVIFDNVFSLTEGSMIDETEWQQIARWVWTLTARGVGVIWIHHTGHKDDHAFGTKTREYDLDCTIKLSKEDARLYGATTAFRLTYEKDRQKTPKTAPSYAEKVFLIVDDRMISVDPLTDAEAEEMGGITPSPRSKLLPKDYLALCDVLCDDSRSQIPERKLKDVPKGVRVTTLGQWRDELVAQGLMEEENTSAERMKFARLREKLISERLIACRMKTPLGDLVWTVKDAVLKGGNPEGGAK